jgi:hypothetical protein
MRDHFNDLPLGEHALTLLILAVIAGAILHGKRLPPSKFYLIWLIIGIYFYLSMWLGVVNGISPAPLWTSDSNFSTWKDYMLVPLVFIASALVADDRNAIKRIVILSAITLMIIDRSCILESMQRSWAVFDESKRDRGPLDWGPNVSAAYLAQFAMFTWGVLQFAKAKKYKIAGWVVIAASLFALLSGGIPRGTRWCPHTRYPERPQATDYYRCIPFDLADGRTHSGSPAYRNDQEFHRRAGRFGPATRGVVEGIMAIDQGESDRR